MAKSQSIIGDQLDKWEGLMKSGHAERVRSEIHRLKLTQIPNHHRRAVANLLRRSGDFHLALKVITPAIFQADMSPRPDQKHSDIVEYSLLLLKTGLAEQALEQLKSVESLDLPGAILSEAFCYIGTWRADQAIPLLHRYVDRNDLSDYQRLIGHVNLLNCLIADNQFEEGLELGERLIGLCRAQNLHRLEGNCLELKGGALVLLNRRADARETLMMASRILRDDTGRYNLQVQKWLDYLDAEEAKNPDILLPVRAAAQQSGNFELMREIDYLRLKIEFNDDLFRFLLFGSRNEAFRFRVLREFSRCPPRQTEEFSVHPNATVKLSLNSGDLNKDELFSPGQKLHQLAFVLGTERYSPFTAGTLHSILYPGEYFNPWTGADRVMQLISRMRKVVRRRGLDLKILESQGAYSMRIESHVDLRIPYGSQLPDRTEILYGRLLQRMGGGTIHRSDISKWLNLSFTAAKRFVAHCIETKRLKVHGRGRSSMYSLPEPAAA